MPAALLRYRLALTEKIKHKLGLQLKEKHKRQLSHIRRNCAANAPSSSANTSSASRDVKYCIQILQSTPVDSHPDNSDLRLIRTHMRPKFRDDQSNIIRLIRISHFSYNFIRSLAIRISRIPLYFSKINAFVAG